MKIAAVSLSNFLKPSIKALKPKRDEFERFKAGLKSILKGLIARSQKKTSRLT